MSDQIEMIDTPHFENEPIEGTDSASSPHNSTLVQSFTDAENFEQSKLGNEQMKQITLRVSELETDVTSQRGQFQALLNLYVGRKSDDNYFLAHGEKIRFNAVVADQSEYLKTALATGMRESQQGVINFHDQYEPRIIKILNIYLHFTPDVTDITMDLNDVIALMRLCTQMNLPEISLKIVQHIEPGMINIPFLLLAHQHLDALCSKAWQRGYDIAVSAIASDIEAFCKAEGFSEIPLIILHDILHSVEQQFSESESLLTVPLGERTKFYLQNGFSLEFEDSDASLKAHVFVTEDHAAAIKVSGSPPIFGCVPTFEFDSAIPFQIGLRRVGQETVLGPSHHYTLIDKTTDTFQNLVHGSQPGEYKVRPKIRSLKLQRQCMILSNYVAARLNPSANTCSGRCLLLEALNYFHRQNRIGRDSAECNILREFTELLSKCAAKCFLYISHSENFNDLQCSAIEDIIKDSTLNTNKNEFRVLEFVIRWSMEPRSDLARKSKIRFIMNSDKEDATDTSDLSESRQTSEVWESRPAAAADKVKDQSHVSEVVERPPFERLIQHVRFPFIPVKKISSLSEGQSGFANLHRVYGELLSEGIQIQSGRKLDSPRACKRARYEGYSPVDWKYLAEKASK